MNTIRAYGPGKFNTIIDSLLWNMTQANGVDAELSEEGFGWRGLLRQTDPTLEVEVTQLPENRDTALTRAEIDFLAAQVGCILSEDSKGQVNVTYFDKADELEAAWKTLEADYAAFIGDDGLDMGDADGATQAEDIPLPKHAAAQHIRKVSGSEIESTLIKAVTTLASFGVPSLVVGGYAVQEHGYPRFTHDVDLVVPDVAQANELLSIRGFRPNPGSSMTLTDRETRVEVDLLPAGGHVGPGPLPLPQPGPLSTTPNIVDLPTLISIKLSSYMGNLTSRLKDAADVVELIKANDLPRPYGVASEVQVAYETLWDGLHPSASKQAYTIDDGPGTPRMAPITLRPRLGFHYELKLEEVPGGYTGTMERVDQETPGPPFKVQGATIGELTKSCWEVLTEGYQLKLDAAQRISDRTQVSQITLEHRREKQNLMAEIERAFRAMPSAPRKDWTKPWEHAPKEG